MTLRHVFIGQVVLEFVLLIAGVTAKGFAPSWLPGPPFAHIALVAVVVSALTRQLVGRQVGVSQPNGLLTVRSGGPKPPRTRRQLLFLLARLVFWATAVVAVLELSPLGTPGGVGVILVAIVVEQRLDARVLAAREPDAQPEP